MDIKVSFSTVGRKYSEPRLMKIIKKIFVWELLLTH